MHCEVLYVDDFSVRGKKIIEAMIRAVPQGVRLSVNSQWQREAPVLMTYGLGHAQRHVWTDAHRRAGGRIIGWDLGYWRRDVPIDFNMRLTIDADHPWQRLQVMPSGRFDSDNIRLRNDFDPNGAIVLCGLGNKQRRWKGLGAREWECRKLSDLRARYPGRRIIYRPKKPEAAPANLELSEGSIEQALRGASLLVCSHSNVAVDACIAGVPVECEDGAAFALYAKNSNPSPAERLAFLHSLAHWQYSTNEAPMAWDFIRNQLQ